MLKAFINRTRERGFTLIELIVVVLIVGVLAAVAIPVYIGVQQQAAKTALRADVNITVKRVQVALTEGATIDQVTANYGAAYVPASSTAGESIRVYGVDADGNVTTAGLVTRDGAATDTAVVSDALYHGLTTPTFRTVSNVTRVSTAAMAAGTTVDFTVGGSLAKASGSQVDYSYGYASATGKFTDTPSFGGGSANVAPLITSNPMANGVVNTTVYNLQVTAAGSPAPTLTVTGLPAGVTFDAATGKIAGKPTATGTYTVVVTASNGAGTDTQTATVKVTSDPGTVTIAQTTIPNPAVGQVYQQQLSNGSTGTAGTISWSATNVPAGLSISAGGGTILGTPTTAGTYAFTVTAKKTLADGAVATDTKVYNLFVATPAAAFGFESTTLPTGWSGSSYRIVPSTAQKFKGSYSLIINDSTIATATYTAPANTLTAGKSYTVSGWVYAGGTCGFSTNNGNTYTNLPYSTSWAPFSATYTYAAGASTNFIVQASSYSTCYFDELAFTPNN